MINDNDYKSGGIMGRYGASSPYPSIDSSLEGAPYTPPGGATGSPAPGTKKMTGRPVASATIPSGFSPDVAGAPASGQTVYNPKPPVTATNGLPLRGTAKSATEGASPGDFSQSDTGAIVTEQKKPLTLPDTFKGSNYDDVIKYLEKKMAEHKPLSEEELKKIRKRQKAEGIISGISDAVRSVANLIATHNYAPDMTVGANMSARAKERFDKEKAEREANDEAFFNYAMNIARLKDADRNQGLQIWQLEHGLEREALDDAYREQASERAQAKADRDAAMAELRMKLLQGKITEQEAEAESAKIESDYAAAFWQSRINKNNRTGSGRSGGKSGGHKGSGGKSSGGTTWYATDAQGNVHSFTAKNGVHANNVAGGNGWNLISSTTTSTSTTDISGNQRTTTRTTKTNTPKKKKNRLGL